MISNTSEFKNKPDGWETTTKEHDGNVWEMSQREEDILLQEFDRRIAFCKFQVWWTGTFFMYESFCCVNCLFITISCWYIICTGWDKIIVSFPPSYKFYFATGFLSYAWLLNLVVQIASFIKTHIFSRRRPIDGWKYMIEEIGPNARKGKGSVSRLPSLSEPSIQPFKEEKMPINNRLTPLRGG